MRTPPKRSARLGERNLEEKRRRRSASAVLSFFWRADFEECYVCTGLTVAEENVMIPSTYNGLRVRVVEWYNWEPEISTRIVSLYISDSVQYVVVTHSLYSGYENLMEIRLPRNPNAMIYGSLALSSCAFYNDPNNWDNGALYMDDWLLATNDDLPEEYTVKQGTYGIAYGALSRLDVIYGGHVKKVTVPDGVQALVGSFEGCASLEEVVLPDSLSSIGYGAFVGCESLESITIPDGVTTVGDNMFFDCGSLTSITIGDGVTFIGNSAFHSCSSLTSIVIPDSVTSIGEGAFAGCESLETVYYRGSEEEWNEIGIRGGNEPLLNAEIVFNYKGE